MILLVGLGNPGPEYKFTRHNMGFLALDTLAEDHHFSPWKEKFKGLVSEGTLKDQKVLLLKPHTFMNLSGQSVIQAMQFYKTPLENVIVFHDELELDPGKLRVKQGGGHAGHNGLKHIDQSVGKDYWRIRLGIGHPRTTGAPHGTSDYVLSKFSPNDAQWLGPFLESVSYHIPLFLEGERDRFVSDVMHDMTTLK